MKNQDLVELKKIVLDACQAIMEIYETEFSVEHKEDASPLTKADLASHEIIVEGLGRLFPDIPILSEESTVPGYEDRSTWSEYWLVDPLDGTKEFANIIQVFEHIIPDHPDFDQIHFMQIAHYKQDSFFAPHKDIADSNDTATMMILLNDNYRGGTINVNGTQVVKSRGTMVCFNNSTEVWHSVEPIYEGERFALLVWFGRDNELD